MFVSVMCCSVIVVSKIGSTEEFSVLILGDHLCDVSFASEEICENHVLLTHHCFHSFFDMFGRSTAFLGVGGSTLVMTICIIEMN